MKLVSTRRDLRDSLEEARREGGTVGLVPTMGYLHEGHLSLVELIRDRVGTVAVSIFVNPLQFGEGEDLDRYPSDLDRDLSLLEARGADLVFHPSVQEMYPGGSPLVTVDPGPMGEGLCGAFRPGHFRGVLTVVARLFGLFRPEVAAFGWKDFQQAVLIRRMVRDLEMGVEVLAGDIVRDSDGLAMSSRNVFLTSEARAQALGIRRSLLAVEEAFRSGAREGDELRGRLRKELEGYPGLVTQYAEIVDPDTLESLDVSAPGSVVAVAAFCGSTRLIDNLVLSD